MIEMIHTLHKRIVVAITILPIGVGDWRKRRRRRESGTLWSHPNSFVSLSNSVFGEIERERELICDCIGILCVIIKWIEEEERCPTSSPTKRIDSRHGICFAVSVQYRTHWFVVGDFCRQSFHFFVFSTYREFRQSVCHLYCTVLYIIISVQHYFSRISILFLCFTIVLYNLYSAQSVTKRTQYGHWNVPT